LVFASTLVRYTIGDLYGLNFLDRQYQYTPAFSERARDELPYALI